MRTQRLLFQLKKRKGMLGDSTHSSMSEEELKAILKEEVDEVERLRFLFTLFFDQTQAFQSELEAQREIALINQQHKELKLQRADTLNFRRNLRNKIVMMVEEEGAINRVSFEVNVEATNAQEHLMYELIKLLSYDDDEFSMVSEPDLDSNQGQVGQYPYYEATMRSKLARLQKF